MPNHVNVSAGAVGVGVFLSLSGALILPRGVCIGADASLAGHVFDVYGVPSVDATAASPNVVKLATWTVPPGATPKPLPNVDGFAVLMLVRRSTGTASGMLRASGEGTGAGDATQTLPAVGDYLETPIETATDDTVFMLGPTATGRDVVDVYLGQDPAATSNEGSTYVGRLVGGGAALHVHGFGYVQIRTVAAPSGESAFYYWAAGQSGAGGSVSPVPGTLVQRSSDGDVYGPKFIGYFFQDNPADPTGLTLQSNATENDLSIYSARDMEINSDGSTTVSGDYVSLNATGDITLDSSGVVKVVRGPFGLPTLAPAPGASETVNLLYFRAGALRFKLLGSETEYTVTATSGG